MLFIKITVIPRMAKPAPNNIAHDKNVAAESTSMKWSF
jgi:hypothetical protein